MRAQEKKISKKVYSITSGSPDYVCAKSEPSQITLFQQFFIHTNENRQKEIRECLQRNQKNTFISQICLLNERLYSQEELGLPSLDKIKQVKICKRLSYSHVFDAAEEYGKGWNILANADIFFDDTLSNLLSISKNEKIIFALLRWEYPSGKIFGPRADSQDSWIWHSTHTPSFRNQNYDFLLGLPGCDNRIAYEFYKKSFQLFNVPEFIKSHHYHTSKVRNYSKEDLILGPFCTISPYLNSEH